MSRLTAFIAKPFSGTYARGPRTASLIAENFPALKRLMIPSCVLSANALPTILDIGPNKLEYIQDIVFVLMRKRCIGHG
ncbi:hypothetical protein Peur_049135 [Populus x canadensis]